MLEQGCHTDVIGSDGGRVKYWILSDCFLVFLCETKPILNPFKAFLLIIIIVIVMYFLFPCFKGWCKVGRVNRDDISIVTFLQSEGGEKIRKIVNEMNREKRVTSYLILLWYLRKLVLLLLYFHLLKIEFNYTFKVIMTLKNIKLSTFW